MGSNHAFFATEVAADHKTSFFQAASKGPEQPDVNPSMDTTQSTPGRFPISDIPMALLDPVPGTSRRRHGDTSLFMHKPHPPMGDCDNQYEDEEDDVDAPLLSMSVTRI